jgi:hypothetical protein
MLLNLFILHQQKRPETERVGVRFRAWSDA